MDTQNLLLPGVVAVVVGLSVIYLIYRFVSSSAPTKKVAGKGKDKTKKRAPAQKKRKKTQPESAAKVAKPVKEDQNETPETHIQPSDEEPKKRAKRRRVKEDPSELENISDFLPLIASKENKAETKQQESKPKVTGKSKIEAAKEEPLAEGWEIVGLKKKEWKDEKKKVKEQEIEKLKKEKEEQEANKSEEAAKKEGKKGFKKGGENREKREGGRDGARERGPKGNRPGDRRNRKDQKDAKVSSPQVSERTKRREEITINGIQFSKFKKDDEDEDEVWELLSDIIENGSSDSDDITPLRTAHLELRYYKEAPSAAPKKRAVASSAESKSQNEAWAPTAGELAKYNYTQGKVEEGDKEKDEGSSETVQTSRVWDLGEEPAAGLIDEKTAELIEAFIKALGHPFTSNLAPAKLSVKGKPQRFLIQTDVDSLRARLLKLLSSGVSLEPPVCRSQSEAAEFVEKLLGYLDAPFVCYTNESQSSDGTYSRGAKFWRKGFGDAGFFIISATQIVMIWFVGYD